MPSFDIVSRTEMTEVDNAVQGAMREIDTRYDFKGSSSTIERNDETLLIKTEDDLKLKQVQELLRGHMAKRKVDVGVLDFKEPEKAFGNSLRQTVLVKQGIEMDRQYVYKYCSPTRSAIQSGRHPYHVNPLNADPTIYNPGDPVSGMAAIPRNMTGMAMKMAAGGYKTHMFGKWDAGTPSIGSVYLDL